tara:strand:- start:1817 stop:2038 length:222 start_codon:yes stop_codon:yes gene_type:complete
MQGIRALLDNVVNSRNLVEMTQSRNLLTSCIENYANQRVIEELEKQVDEYFKQPVEIDLSKRLIDRIQELKQK